MFSRAATSDPDVATLRPVRRNPYLMISLDAPEHTRVRRLVARAFTPRSIELRRPRIDQPADDLMTRLIQARDEENRLSEPELLNNIYILLSGGTRRRPACWPIRY